MTVEAEESAFEDDLSLPRSGTSSYSSIHRKENFHELRKYKSSGRSYYIAKEIYLTEKTYVKDLEVITVSFRNAVEKDNTLSERSMKLLFDNIDPLYDFHCSLLAELEERIHNWENGSITESSRDSVQKIGDIMHRNMRQMKMYARYILKHQDIILALEAETKRSKKFEEVYKEFELSKVCYLSLNSFFLKPVQRFFYYKNMLSKLSKEYSHDHPDAIDTKVAYEEITEACKQIETTTANLENLHKVVELQRDLVGVEDLVHPQRVFIREGCLHKICRKGPQPRMFFLFSDLLLFTSQGVTATSQFRARAQIPLRLLKVEEGGVELHGLYSFTLSGGSDTTPFVVAANSPEEKYKWMEDIQNSINRELKKSKCGVCHSNKSEFMLYVGQENSNMCMNCNADMERLAAKPPNERLEYWQSIHPPPPVLKRSTADADSDDEGSYSLQEYYSSLDRRHAHARTISTRRVCWHRNASISMKEYTLSLQNCISGELLRKYKNTSKWQKLWVVFTNFCLYFFKNYEEETPVASLPLIGYTISKATENEDEYVFKLQFKTHTYQFRALTEYSFERWCEVLSLAMKNNSLKPTRRMPAGLS